MTLSLSEPSSGSVNWASTINSDFASIQDFLNNRRLPTSFIQGLRTTWSSDTTISVGAGSCRDNADAADMILSASATVNLASNGVNGLDTKTATGTVSMSSGSKTVTGTSSAFLTDFGTRNLSAGTIGTGGVASTTITGSGTSFLSQVALSDLIGNSSVGYARVTAIASDTSLTVSQSLTIANGSTGTVIENPTIKLTSGGTEQFQVDEITSNTSLLTVVAAGVAHAAGSTMTIGAAPNVTTGFFLFVWLVAGTSGTQPIVSTQRTTLLNPGTGYSVSARRIGSLTYLVNQIIEFIQRGTNNRRDYWFTPQGSDGFNLLSNGSSTSLAAVAGNPYTPATGHTLKLETDMFTPTGTTPNYTGAAFSPRGIQSSSYFNEVVETVTGLDLGVIADVPCDGAQFVWYFLTQATGANTGLYLDLIGYAEDL